MIVGFIVVIRSHGIPKYVGPFPTIAEAMAYARDFPTDVDWNWAYLNAGDDGEDLT